jgi:hypothetical protein
MNPLRQAAQQALEALEKTHTQPGCEQRQAERKASVALRDALEQPEQEPVAPYAWMAVGGTIWRRKTSEDDVPLYTHPPRREWRGLKEWEINDGRDQLPTEDLCNWSFRQGVYFAEKALKERNA